MSHDLPYTRFDYSSEGDPEQAVIIQVLYTTALDTLSTDEDLDLIQFSDGTALSYHSKDKHLNITSTGTGTVNVQANGEQCTVQSAGDVLLKAAGTLTMEAAKHVIKGPVEQTGGDMTSDGVSVQEHIHDGVAAGTAKSKKPVK